MTFYWCCSHLHRQILFSPTAIPTTFPPFPCDRISFTEAVQRLFLKQRTLLCCSPTIYCLCFPLYGWKEIHNQICMCTSARYFQAVATFCIIFPIKGIHTMRIGEIIHEDMNRLILLPTKIKPGGKKQAVHAPSSTNGTVSNKKEKKDTLLPSYS